MKRPTKFLVLVRPHILLLLNAINLLPQREQGSLVLPERTPFPHRWRDIPFAIAPEALLVNVRSVL